MDGNNLRKTSYATEQLLSVFSFIIIMLLNRLGDGSHSLHVLDFGL